MVADPLALTLAEASALIHRREISPVELTEACLARIAAVEPALGAFITVTADRARADARERERELATGRDRGPLHGIPIALKDLYDTVGIRTTAGSTILRDRLPVEDAQVVRALADAGSVLLGKLNLHEWALGVTNRNPHFGPTRNPWALDRIPGGSSGGSAAALASGECFGSLGSDTGGSIRIPASLCGIVGLKPTYGRVSLRGVIPLSWSLDHAGPMARTVRDAAILLAAIAGYDAADPVSVDVPTDDYLADLDSGVRGLRIGIPTELFNEDLDPEVDRAVRAATDVLRRAGAQIVETGFPLADRVRAAQGAILLSDAAAYHREDLAERAGLIGADVLARLRRGAATDPLDLAAARRTQVELRRALGALFTTVDALVVPATPIVAPQGDGADAVAAAVRLTAFTGPFNLAGLPAIVLPCGFTAPLSAGPLMTTRSAGPASPAAAVPLTTGLPIGLQIAAGPWRERLVLRIAAAYERETPWHDRRPALRLSGE